MSGMMKYDKYKVMNQHDKIEYINGLVKSQSDLISQTLPNRNQIERFLRSLTLAIGSANQQLLNCTPYSIFSSCLNLAYFGLDPSPYLGHGYLVPFKDRATLVIGYKGYVYLMLKSGLFNNVNAEVVYDKEEFCLQLGMCRSLIHSPSAPSLRGEAKGAYTTLQYKEGHQDFCWMWWEEIKAIRDGSRGYNPQAPSGPWLNHPGEMMKKTPTRRIIKLAQFPVGDDRFRVAAEVDGSQEGGVDLLKQELKVGAIKDVNGNWLEPDPEPTKDNEVTVEATVTEVEPAKTRPGAEAKVTPEVSTSTKRLSGLIEEMKDFGVDLTDLYQWFEKQGATSVVERIVKTEEALELLGNSIPWLAISGQDEEEPKQEETKQPEWMKKSGDDEEIR